MIPWDGTLKKQRAKVETSSRGAAREPSTWRKVRGCWQSTNTVSSTIYVWPYACLFRPPSSHIVSAVRKKKPTLLGPWTLQQVLLRVLSQEHFENADSWHSPVPRCARRFSCSSVALHSFERPHVVVRTLIRLLGQPRFLSVATRPQKPCDSAQLDLPGARNARWLDTQVLWWSLQYATNTYSHGYVHDMKHVLVRCERYSFAPGRWELHCKPSLQETGNMEAGKFDLPERTDSLKVGFHMPKSIAYCSSSQYSTLGILQESAGPYQQLV